MNTAHTNSAFVLHQTRRASHSSQGFSLIELLLVVAVLGVLLAVTGPVFARMVSSSKLTTASNAFLYSIYLARSEAIKRKGRVSLCKSENGLSCSVTGGWEQGWIVFDDNDSNGQRDPDEAILERVQPLSSNLRLTGNLPVSKYVSYVASGGTKLIGGGFQAGTVTVCSGSSAEARQIIVNATGRPRIQKVSSIACA